MNPTLETIFKRRSIRQFTDQPLDEETIKSLLQAAMSAPSGMNSQPWEFIVLTDPEVLTKVRAKLPFARHNAPVGIMVLGSPERAGNAAGRRFWIQDCSAAMENMLIAAVGLGLGAVWIGIHPIETFVRSMRAILNIPAEVIPLGMMHVGFPAEDRPARTQYDENKVHWQAYHEHTRKNKIKPVKLQP